MPGVVGVQLRNGIEADYRIKYATPEMIYADYDRFVTHARNTSVFADYELVIVLQHTAKSYYHFLRRPTIAIALLLTLLMLLMHRKLPDGAGILVLWTLGYTLALSPAYYTPRGALLPELALLPLLPLLLPLLFSAARWRTAIAVLVVLILAAQWRAGRFARAMWNENMHFAKVSRQFGAYREANDIAPQSLVVSDARVIWLPFSEQPNPWCLPYPRTEQFWTEDPAISPRQVPGAPIRTVDELRSGPADVEFVLMSKSPPRDTDSERISASVSWMIVERFGDQVLFRTTRPPSLVEAED